MESFKFEKTVIPHLDPLGPENPNNLFPTEEKASLFLGALTNFNTHIMQFIKQMSTTAEKPKSV